MKVQTEMILFRDLLNGEVFILKSEHGFPQPMVKISSIDEGVTALRLRHTESMTYMCEVGLDEEVIKCSEIVCKF